MEAPQHGWTVLRRPPLRQASHGIVSRLQARFYGPKQRCIQE